MIYKINRYKLFRFKKYLNNMVNFKRMCFKRNGIIKLLIGLIILIICYVFGFFTHLFEKDLSEFNKQYTESNFELQIASQHLNENDQIYSKFNDINNLNFTFLYKSQDACKPIKLEKKLSNPFLTILVKSKYSNFKHRESIRETWGQTDKDLLIRTVFLIGDPNLDINDNKEKIKIESKRFNDLIQQDFIDTYYNNTLKTCMAIKWINNYCSNSKFYLLIDDDFYLSK